MYTCIHIYIDIYECRERERERERDRYSAAHAAQHPANLGAPVHEDLESGRLFWLLAVVGDIVVKSPYRW